MGSLLLRRQEKKKTGGNQEQSGPNRRRVLDRDPPDLQTLIDQCYENGGYDTIDCRQPLQPPLDQADLAWAEEWLRAKGLR